MWRHIFTKIGLVGLVILVLVSCEAVNDLLGTGDDDDQELPANLQVTDWSQSRYNEIARVTGSRRISVPSSHAGDYLLYVVTNSGSSNAVVSVPYASNPASITSSSILGSDVAPESEAGRAIAGFPGQFDELIPVGRPSSSMVGASSLTANAAVGDTYTFAAATGNREARLEVQRSDGTWSLNVWLHTTDPYTVTSEMLNAVADRFLMTGADNDIFDWVTPVFGDPWGTHQYSDIIGQDRRDIHILLYDIDGDGVPGPNEGRVVGYFWSKDNFLEGTTFSDPNVPSSNGRLMFYMDSALLSDDSDGDGLWELTDTWPESIVSTLAHEFQHMIQFYQRVVIVSPDAVYSTWLNELTSEVAEDLVSRRLGTRGPRGVDPADGTAGSPSNSEGRMPWYNAFGDQTSLVSWNGDIQDYAASYAFGAFLLRTFGAEFFHILLTETPADSSVVDYSVSSVTRAASSLAGQTISMEELLRRWGVAIAVSDDTSVPQGYRLNRNGFITTSGGGVSYSVGSLNAYNYGGFWYGFGTGSVEIEDTANAFFIGGIVPQGGVNLDFSLPTGVEITVLTWD